MMGHTRKYCSAVHAPMTSPLDTAELLTFVERTTSWTPESDSDRMTDTAAISVRTSPANTPPRATAPPMVIPTVTAPMSGSRAHGQSVADVSTTSCRPHRGDKQMVQAAVPCDHNASAVRLRKFPAATGCSGCTSLSARCRTFWPPVTLSLLKEVFVWWLLH